MEIKFAKIERIHTGTDEVMSFPVPRALRFEYRELIKKAQPTDRYDLVLATPRRKRSVGPHSQNHHLNGHCAQISRETGQDFETVKLYAKRMAIPRGLPLKTKPNGDVLMSLVDGQPVPISENEMDMIQCGWVIEELHILAAELGIVLQEE